DRGPQLVAEPPQKVSPALTLPSPSLLLGSAGGGAAVPTGRGPADQAAAHAQLVPGAIGRREAGIGRPVPAAAGQLLHPATHADPQVIDFVPDADPGVHRTTEIGRRLE